MQVYKVKEQDYGVDYGVETYFSTFEKAKRYCHSKAIPYEAFLFIQEFLAGEDREFASEGEFFEELLIASRSFRFI